MMSQDNDMKLKIPHLDKTAFSIIPLGDEESDKAYWLSRSPAERWNAIELNRRLVYGEARCTERFQRFFEIVELKKS
jgi:hypothetical protein